MNLSNGISFDSNVKEALAHYAKRSQIISSASKSSVLSPLTRPSMGLKDLKSMMPTSLTDSFDDSLEFEELPKSSCNNKIKKAFALIDTDNDGHISCRELVAFLASQASLSEQSEIEQGRRYLQYFMPKFTKSTRDYWTFEDFNSFMTTQFK